MLLVRQYLFTNYKIELLCDNQIRYIKLWILLTNSASRQRDLRLKLYMIIWKLHAKYVTNSLLMWSTRTSERQFTRWLWIAEYDHSLSGPGARRRSFCQFLLFVQTIMQILLLLSSLTRWTYLGMLSSHRHKQIF